MAAHDPCDTRRVGTDGRGRPAGRPEGGETAAVDLYWLPLGAGGHFVRLNAVIAWVIERSGIDAASIRPPAEGRAPGWQAGVVVARRKEMVSGAVSD
jgi:hypothetical protein